MPAPAQAIIGGCWVGLPGNEQTYTHTAAGVCEILLLFNNVTVGEVEISRNASDTFIGQWVAPYGAGRLTHQIRYTNISGTAVNETNLTGAGTWDALTSTRWIGLSRGTIGTSDTRFQVEIRDSVSLAILASAFYNLQVTVT